MRTGTMRAYVLTRYGGPAAAVLRDVPVPRPGPGELLVDVRAAALNPVDHKTRSGKLLPLFRYRLPAVMGKDFAGTVAACGEGVRRFSAGDRVFGRVAQDAMGAFAGQVAVRAELVEPMPVSLDFPAAAAVPLAAQTALQALRLLEAGPGKRILVAGGTGGVGTFAIQIAKLLGAHVTTTASASGLALVESLGADAAVDYRGRGLSRVRGLDGALDLVGVASLPRIFSTVRPGGRVVSVAAVPGPMTALRDLGGRPVLALLFLAASLPVRALALAHLAGYRYLFMRPEGAELAQLASWIDAGKIRVILDRVYPFEEIGAAMARLEEGHARGKIVVRMHDG